MQYPHELHVGCMSDLRFDDCILSSLQHQQEITSYKCLQILSGHDNCFVCYDANGLISKFGFQGYQNEQQTILADESCFIQLILRIAPPSQ